jgi:hypothetical protein
MITKGQIIDDVVAWLTKFELTDDSRFATIGTFLSWKIDQLRAEWIIRQYNQTGVIDQVWLSDLGIVKFNPVNFSDDPNVTYCQCEISKTFIPSVVSLFGYKGGNADIGLYSVMSTCGKTQYYYLPMTTWQNIPSEHIRSKFHYYQRINTAIYVNKVINSLRITAILQNPGDGYLINSAPVPSGSIVTGTTYIVKYGSVVYNSTQYLQDSTFVGVAGQTSYVGSGFVVLQSQQVALDLNQPYPIDAAMARGIVLDILTKEFKIEAAALTDNKDDQVDEQIKDQPVQ